MSRITGKDDSDSKPRPSQPTAKAPSETWPTGEEESASGLEEDFSDSDAPKTYLRIDLGLNTMPDVKIKDIGPDPVNLVGLSDAKLKIDPGFEMMAAFGRRLSDDLYFEITTGIAYNYVSEIEGTVYRDNGAGGISNESSIEGGTGDLLQWPITVGIGYRLDLSDSIKLNLNAGAGIQLNYSYLYDPSVSGFGFSSDYYWWQTSFGLRGQAGASLSFAISSRMSFAIYGTWSAVSSANFGKAELITSSLGDQDLDAGMFMNYAIGGSLVFEF